MCPSTVQVASASSVKTMLWKSVKAIREPFITPYTYDTSYKCRVYDASLVADVLRNSENGAGATLDENLLTTRGNENYGVTAIKGIAASDDAQVVGIGYYGVNGSRYATPQNGLNIMVFQMSDGTTQTQKIYK